MLSPSARFDIRTLSPSLCNWCVPCGDIVMGPKSKGGKAALKEEWCLCPSSGLLYHQGDGAAHEKWLEEGSQDNPTHPHISGDQLTSRLATKPSSSLAFSLPESTLFSSVFLSPASASACKIGQGTLLNLTSTNTSMVVRAFISRELTGKPDVFCVPHSWPDMLDLPSLITLAPIFYFIALVFKF